MLRLSIWNKVTSLIPFSIQNVPLDRWEYFSKFKDKTAAIIAVDVIRVLAQKLRKYTFSHGVLSILNNIKYDFFFKNSFPIIRWDFF